VVLPKDFANFAEFIENGAIFFYGLCRSPIGQNDRKAFLCNQILIMQTLLLLNMLDQLNG
jgi:hypothetical protein